MHVKTPLGIEVVGAGERRRATYARVCALVAAPKREYVRSPQLLANVGKLDFCTLCSCVRPVVAAHSNWAEHGKGAHIKADDNRIAAACTDCHRELDQGSHWSEAERRERWARGHRMTVGLLLARGLWPARVPVPDTAHPFAALAASPGD